MSIHLPRIISRIIITQLVRAKPVDSKPIVAQAKLRDGRLEIMRMRFWGFLTYLVWAFYFNSISCFCCCCLIEGQMFDLMQPIVVDDVGSRDAKLSWQYIHTAIPRGATHTYTHTQLYPRGAQTDRTLVYMYTHSQTHKKTHIRKHTHP